MVKAIESSGTQSNLESVTASLIKKGPPPKTHLEKKVGWRNNMSTASPCSTVIRSLANMIPFNLDLLQLVYPAG